MMNFNDTFKGIFGSLDGDMCRLTMNGKIAVKTSSGYKSYNVKTGRLVNCSSFVFNIGEEFFFVIPTNKVEKGDIILVNGKPRCVVESKKNQITVINYEDSTVELFYLIVMYLWEILISMGKSFQCLEMI